MLKVNIHRTLFVIILALRAAETILGQAVTGGFSVDISDREAVRAFHNAVYAHRANVRPDWNGSVTNCLPGTTSPTYQDAVLTRLNFYRAMCGVPASVTFNDPYSLRSQAAALIMSANDEISHVPVEGWLCFSTFGAEGADNSNLAIGSAGMDAVDAYIIDAGPNYRAGHRRWVIYPKTQIMGTGDIDPPDGSEEQKANSLWIFDEHFSDPRPATRESFVSWPPPGFVPNTLVYARWSFSVSGADFTNALVTMTSNGVPVAIHKEKVETGYGENTVVFVPHGLTPQMRLFWPKPAQDVVYDVRIDNVVLRGNITNYAYRVTVFDPERPLGEWSSLRLAGPGTPQAQRINRYGYRAFPKASGYDFRFSRLANDLPVQGAEDANPQVVSWISGLYPLVQTNIAATGQASFHLAHSKPPRPQWLMLQDAFVPRVESELRFQSRLGGSTAEQVARVQVSLDEGSSWRDLYAQAGDGTVGELAFVPRKLSLAPFAGRAIWIRFNFGFIFGPVSFARGSEPGVGWYLDDIEVTDAQRLAEAIVTGHEGPDFEFIPPRPGDYYLNARPRFYQEFTGEWSPGLAINAVEPAPTALSMKRISKKTETDLEIEFEVVSLSPWAVLRVEQSFTFPGEWKGNSNAVLNLVEGDSKYTAKIKRSDSRSGFYRIVAE